MRRNISISHTLLVVMASVFLASCVQQPAKKSHLSNLDKELERTHNQTIMNSGSTQSAQAFNLDDLYTLTLTPRAAIQIFMAQSPRVQAVLSELQEADAQELQANIIGNPHLSLGILKPTDGKYWLWDANLMQPLFDLLTRTTRKKVAAQAARESELIALDQLHLLIAEFQVDYFKAVNGQQNTLLAKNQLEASEARASLAKAIYRAGNISELEYLEHETEYQKEQLRYADQLLADAIGHARLTYWFASAKLFTLPSEFPDLPTHLWDLDQLKKIAYENNAELKGYLLKQQLLSDQMLLVKNEYGLAQSELGIAGKQEADGSKAIGLAADIPLGIFDNGKAKMMSLDAKRNSLLARQRDFKLQLDFKINEAVSRMKSTFENFQILEKTKTISERRLELAQQQMNFMLKSPFDLIDLKYEILNIENELGKAKLMYWENHSQLEALVGQTLIPDTRATPPAMEIKK